MMILKKVFILLAYVLLHTGLHATVDAQILLYQTYDYVQGPFRHQEKIPYPENTVLVPEFITVMLTSEDNLYEKIFSALKEKDHQVYKVASFELRNEQPVVIIEDTDDDTFLKIKNEILASFRANIDVKEVEFIRNGVSESFYDVDHAIFTFEPKDALVNRGAAPLEESLLNLPLWISIALNILLIIYLIITNRNKINIKKGQ